MQGKYEFGFYILIGGLVGCWKVHSLHFNIGLATPESWIEYCLFCHFTWPQHSLKGSGMWIFDGLQ